MRDACHQPAETGQALRVPQLALDLFLALNVFLERHSQAIDRLDDTLNFFRITLGFHLGCQVAFKTLQSTLDLPNAPLQVANNQ